MVFTITIVAMMIAYLLGSMNSSILVCKLFQLDDPRQQGSGNPGTTNVLRMGHKKAAILTLTGDIMKGFIAVLLAKACSINGFNLSLVALAVFIGHLYPLFFQFKGGKGVATLIGSLLGLSLLLGMAAIMTWLLIVIVFRYSSVAGITVAMTAPINTVLLNHSYYLMSLIIMAIYLVKRHRNNINNLHSGQEKLLFNTQKK